MPPADVNRELGELSQRVSRLEKDTHAQTIILTELRDMMIAARGSWKTIMAVSGAAAAVGGLAVKFGALLFPAFPK